MEKVRHLTAIIAFIYITGFIIPAFAASPITFYGSFTDKERNNRTLLYKVYMSSVRVNERKPVVIFSHGLGGSVEAAPYLGEALAENGYIAIFIQHPGSDKGLWEGTKRPLQIKKILAESVRNPEATQDRYKDLSFVLDELEKMNKWPGPLRDRLDLDHIGMAGHSYGARSVMIAAGERTQLAGTQFSDPRIRAAIPLSPNLPQYYFGKNIDEIPDIYSAVKIPLFHITGTEDDYPFSRDFNPAIRTIPYQKIHASDQYLLVLHGADHAVFGAGRKVRRDDNDYQKKVAEGAVLFFDAYLKEDQNAKTKLRQTYKTGLSDDDRFEFK